MPPLPYQYSELPGKDWIRLITILSERDGKIEIRLSVHALSSSPPYETLSYLWGTSGESKTINCEGGNLDVTDNLYLCLLELREEVSRRFLWIDAICINQSDAGERSRTIPLIPSIYKYAARTIGWIVAPLQPSVSRLVDRL
jgi:Heterokaryon incompatibility protein (HET)